MCHCQVCGNTEEKKNTNQERTFAIAVNGNVIFTGLTEWEVICEYEALVPFGGNIRVFQHVNIVPFSCYKIV